MDIVSEDAAQRLMYLAFLVGKDPSSWEGWVCLRVCLREEDGSEEKIGWAAALLNSYLKETEGKVYACNATLYAVCRYAPWDILQQAGRQVRYLLGNREASFCSVAVFDLGRDGPSFVADVQEREGRNVLGSGTPPVPPPGIDFTPLAEDMEPSPYSLPVGHARVLLVEDDPVTRWMVRNALKNECLFASAGTASAAFSVFSSWRPDLVFLDINLPDKNGHEVLDWIMRNDPGARVVMFSSAGDIDNISAALEDGASGFVAKPFQREKLLHYIHRHAG